ncbi:hypothetical protein BU14_1886s0001, partial [Porphyra umbilicalis]
RTAAATPRTGHRVVACTGKQQTRGTHAAPCAAAGGADAGTAPAGPALAARPRRQRHRGAALPTLSEGGGRATALPTFVRGAPRPRLPRLAPAPPDGGRVARRHAAGGPRAGRAAAPRPTQNRGRATVASPLRGGGGPPWRGGAAPPPPPRSAPDAAHQTPRRWGWRRIGPAGRRAPPHARDGPSAPPTVMRKAGAASAVTQRAGGAPLQHMARGPGASTRQTASAHGLGVTTAVGQRLQRSPRRHQSGCVGRCSLRSGPPDDPQSMGPSPTPGMLTLLAQPTMTTSRRQRCLPLPPSPARPHARLIPPPPPSAAAPTRGHPPRARRRPAPCRRLGTGRRRAARRRCRRASAYRMV